MQSRLNVGLPGRSSSSRTYITSLWKLGDNLNKHTHSLDALDISRDKYMVILSPLILVRLPNDIRLKWARERSEREGDVSHLITFLQCKIERKDRSESTRTEKGVYCCLRREAKGTNSRKKKSLGFCLHPSDLICHK